MKKKPVDISLQGCLELFISRCDDKNLSSVTIQFYVNNIGRFINYLVDEHNLENPLVKDFKAEYIKKYLLKAKNSKKWEGHSQIITKKEKLSSQSVRTYTRALRALEIGFLQKNISKKIFWNL